MEKNLNSLNRAPDGSYYWTYYLEGESNKSLLKLYLLIFGLIVLIPGAILFFMIFGRQIQHGVWYDTGGYLGIWLAVFAGVEALTYVIYTVIDKAQGGSTPMRYEMNEVMITSHPESVSRRVPRYYLQTDFPMVNDVKVDAKSDLILLYEFLRVTHVYVYPEDRSFVLKHILDRVPQSKKIESRKEQYEIYLKNQ